MIQNIRWDLKQIKTMRLHGQTWLPVALDFWPHTDHKIIWMYSIHRDLQLSPVRADIAEQSLDGNMMSRQSKVAEWKVTNYLAMAKSKH